MKEDVSERGCRRRVKVEMYDLCVESLTWSCCVACKETWSKLSESFIPTLWSTTQELTFWRETNSVCSQFPIRFD